MKVEDYTNSAYNLLKEKGAWIQVEAFPRVTYRLLKAILHKRITFNNTISPSFLPS